MERVSPLVAFHRHRLQLRQTVVSKKSPILKHVRKFTRPVDTLVIVGKTEHSSFSECINVDEPDPVFDRFPIAPRESIFPSQGIFVIEH